MKSVSGISNTLILKEDIGALQRSRCLIQIRALYKSM